MLVLKDGSSELIDVYSPILNIEPLGKLRKIDGVGWVFVEMHKDFVLFAWDLGQLAAKLNELNKV